MSQFSRESLPVAGKSSREHETEQSPMMPPWGKTLTDEEVDALIGHLRKLCACEGKK